MKSILKRNGKRILAVIILISMLPFSDFIGIFGVDISGADVYGAALKENTVSENIDTNTPEETTPVENSEEQQLEMPKSVLQENYVEISENTTLSEDWEIDGDLYVTGGSLSLNGHTVKVSGSLIHSGGRIYLDDGSLYVEGDYRRQSLIQEEDGYSYGPVENSYFSMTSEKAYFFLGGNLYDYSMQNASVYMEKGVFELKGSILQDDEATEHFNFSNGHTLLLSGESRQILHFAETEDFYGSRIENLMVSNISEEGVVIEGAHDVYGSFTSERESHIEGVLRFSKNNVPSEGYYAGDVAIKYSSNFIKPFEIGGDLYVEQSAIAYVKEKLRVAGNVYLNYKLYAYADFTVGGDVFCRKSSNSGGAFFVYGGNTLIEGNVNVEGGTSLCAVTVNAADAYVCIKGDYIIQKQPYNNILDNYGGTMEVCGNIDWQRPVQFTDGSKLILSGDAGQHVSVAEDTYVESLELRNESADGISFDTIIDWYNISGTIENAFYQGKRMMPGVTLKEDTVIDHDVCLCVSDMNLNGHTLTIQGDLCQKNARMILSGGTLIVRGDYVIGDESENQKESSTVNSMGSLVMAYPNDYVRVDGKFSFGWNKVHYPGNVYNNIPPDVFMNGVLEVKGDFTANTFGNGTFAVNSGNNHTVLLSGENEQTVLIAQNGAYNLQNLVMTNTSEAGIIFQEKVQVQNLVSAAEDVHITGLLSPNYSTQFENGYYPGDMVIENIMQLPLPLEIGGNLYVNHSLMMLAGNLTVSGDVEVAAATKDTPEAALCMMDELSVLNIGGDYTNRSTDTKLSKGTINIKGDYTDECALTYGEEHRIVFCGDERQTICTEAKLGTIELQNPAGVYSEKAFEFAKLVSNGYRLIVADEEGMLGYTLGQDEVMDGNLYLTAGKMDLNGHTLIVNGDVILQGGTLELHHGTLIVEGDFRQQYRYREESGFRFDKTDGKLCMLYDDDRLMIKKDAYFMLPSSEYLVCKSGNMHIEGNWNIPDKDTHFKSEGCVELAGNGGQAVCGAGTVQVKDLKLTNQSLEGIEIIAAVSVTGALTDRGNKAAIKGKIGISDLNQLEEGKYKGDIILTGNTELMQDLQIEGNLTIDGKGSAALNCGTQKIVVNNLVIKGKLEVFKARLEIEANLTKYTGGELVMENESGYIQVGKNLDINMQSEGGTKAPVLNAGTIEVKGNVIDKSYAGDYAVEHRILLSGDQKQELDTDAFLGTLEIANNSAEGVYSEKVISAKRVIDRQKKLVTGDGSGSYGDTLTEDLVIDGDYKLLGGVMDLNGHTLHIKGKLNLEGGTVFVHGGKLIVDGDLQFRSLYYSGNKEIGSSTCGCIRMEKQEDYLFIGGDWIFDKHSSCNCNFESGNVELKGNLLWKESYYSKTSQIIKSTLTLSGDEKQTISADDRIVFYDVISKNQSADGVLLLRTMLEGKLTENGNYVTGTISIRDFSQLDQYHFAGAVEIKNGTAIHLEHDVSVGGDLDIRGELYCGKHSLTAGATSVWGKLCLEQGTMKANGDMSVNYSGMLSMKDKAAYLLVKGNFNASSMYDDWNYGRRAVMDLSAGVLEVKGNYSDYACADYDKDFKLLLSGESLQEICTESCMGTIELQNHSEEGVYSAQIINLKKMIYNGCKLTIGNLNGLYGYTLEEDMTLAGDIILFGDTLDLNGHTLTIQGDFILKNGTLKINGGTLIVKNDFCLQSGMAEKEWNNAHGVIVMDTEKDRIEIDGSMYLQPAETCEWDVHAGTILLQGDLERIRSYAWNYPTNNQTMPLDCTLIMAGEQKQTLTLLGTTPVKNLIVDQKLAAGVELNADLKVTGELSTKSGGLLSGKICIDDISQVSGEYFDGGLVLEGDSTLQHDLTVTGGLTIEQSLNCGGYRLQAERITTNGTLDIKKASVICKQDLVVENKGLLVMNQPEAYVLVEGSFIHSGKVQNEGYLTDGVLEVMQDITIRDYHYFKTSDNHYTILRRIDAVDVTPVKQDLDLSGFPVVEAGKKYPVFAHMELTKNDQQGYVQKYVNMETYIEDVVYVTRGAAIPDPVTEIAATKVTETSVTLQYNGNWQTGYIKGFTIYRNGVKLALTNSQSFQDTGLLPGETYVYKVYPYNVDKRSAANSPECTVTTTQDTAPPSVPDNLLIAKRSGSAITLQWNESKDNVEVKGYRLYRDGTLIYDGAEAGFKDENLQKNTLYTYEVMAYDGKGNESEHSKQVDGVVYMPKILSVSPEDYTDIGGECLTIRVVCENGGNTDRNSLTIAYYDEALKSYIPLTNLPLGQEQSGVRYRFEKEWNISTLQMDGDLNIKFTLRDEDGNETEKVITYVLDRTAPQVPKELSAQDDEGTVLLSWEMSKSADCSAYVIYRVNADEGTGAELATVNGRSSTSYQDKAVTDGGSYQYYVRAKDKFENISPMSNIAKVTVGADTKAPKVISMLPAAGKINKSVTLHVEGSDNRQVSAFEFYIRAEDEEEWTFLSSAEAKEDAADYVFDTTAYKEDIYFVKVVALDAGGNQSTELFMRRYSVDNTGIAKIHWGECSVGSTAIQLEWEDVQEDDFGYFLVEEEIDGQWKEIARVSQKLGHRIENLEPNSSHTYRVTGVDALGNIGMPSDRMMLVTKEDTKPPVIKRIHPVSSYYGKELCLSMTVEDNGGVAGGSFSYSVDGTEYIPLASVDASGGKSEELSYVWDISAIPEGEVTVRFEAYDTAGYHNSLYEEKEIEAKYWIDHTAPQKVSGVLASSCEGSITLEWESVSGNDIDHYEIERANQDDGYFKTVAENVRYLNYHDTEVAERNTYCYRVYAVDLAGNRSVASDEVWASVLPDEEPPKVRNILPAAEILGSNPQIEVIATDNATLQEMTLEYREKDSDDIWHELAVAELSKSAEDVYFIWDTKELYHGKTYEIRACALDRSGNESEYCIRAYTLDLEAPAAPKLDAAPESFAIQLRYTPNEETDFRCYKIYRKAYGETDYTCIQSTTDTTYTDKVPKTDLMYYYKVRAYDIYGNYSESQATASYANHIDRIAPVAELPETIFGYTGMEVAFDSGLCSDNVRINRYEWDFGDGTGKSAARPTHAYEKAGVYSVVLTVTDGAGNTAMATTSVQVMDKSNTGMTLLCVHDQKGEAISGAYVYVKTGKEENDCLKLRTDKNGEAKLIAKAGIYEYSAFATGYLPSESTVRISNYGEEQEEISLEKGEVVTGELTVERMSLEEMIEKGVDLSAPENYHTYRFKTELWFAKSPLPVVIDTVEDNFGIPKTDSVNSGTPIGTYTQGNSTIQVSLVEPKLEEDGEKINPAITYLETTQTVSWMKDMYDVELGIINNADSGFVITDASATLNLPEGMSLAATSSGQTMTTQFADIDGQERRSASWVVKGDKTGTYELSASFHGVLQPFMADIDAEFKTETECVVPGGEGIHIYIYPEDCYYPGEDYYIQFEIVNESNREIYNLSTSLGEYISSSKTTEVFVKDVNDSERLVRTIRSSGQTYRSATAAKCRQLPVLYGGDIIDVGVFGPGEKIRATYCQRMGEKTDTEYYYRLIDSLVKAVEGENLGVEVTLEPIGSHIYKYITYVGTRIEEEEDLDELMGDPIDMTTGAFLQELNTITLNGGNNLSLNLSYNSMLADYVGEAGFGWSHEYEQHLEDYGSSIVLFMNPHTQISFISDEANRNISYGSLKEDMIVLDGESEYVGTFVPVTGGSKDWKITKDTQGYTVTADEKNTYRFDAEGRLVRMDKNGETKISLIHEENSLTIMDEITKDYLMLTYDEAGWMKTVSDGNGRMVTLSHENGNLTGITGVDGNTSQYHYDDAHHMTLAVNALGKTYVTNSYDAEGRVLTQKEPGKAAPIQISYTDTADGGTCVHTSEGIEIITDAAGRKIETTDNNGAVTTYFYDKSGNLIDERDTYDNTVMYQYDEENHLTATYDTAGNVTFTEYDDKGNPILVTDQTGIGTSFAYDENDNLIRSVNALGEVTRYVYDDEGYRIREVKDGLGVISYEYAQGRLLNQTDANGNKTVFTYDQYGNIASQTDALGNVTAFEYTPDGKLLKETLPDGMTTTYTYDALGQKTATTQTAPDGSSRKETFSYDAQGRITKIADTSGNATTYTYDDHGNKTSTTYANGTKDIFAYDTAGNLISKQTAGGSVTTYTYDLKRNVLSETTDQTTIRYEYYPNGKVYKKYLPDGQFITYSYDNCWRCIQALNSNGNSTGYTYDHEGNLISTRDPLGNTIKYAYDIYGRCIKETDPNGNETRYQYDANGNCIAVADASGKTTHTQYDALNRPVKMTVETSKEEISVSYTYDALGRTISTTDEDGITTYMSYDGFGNLTRLTDQNGNVLQKNSYDALSRLSRTTDAVGNVTAYSYDKLDQITKIVSCLGTEDQVQTTYQYDKDGHLLSVVDAQGHITRQTLDARGNVLTLTDAMGGTTGYSYDSMNRVTKLINAVGAENSYTYNAEGLLSESINAREQKTKYQYDAAGRIISKKDEAGTITYTYDKNGNILTVSDKTGTISRTYDCMNRVTEMTDNNGNTVKYTYDELGNRISITYPGGETVRYAYNKNGTIKTVTDPQGKQTLYTYDDNGNLTETKRADGSKETCTYNLAGQLVELTDETAAGNTINHYTYTYDGRGNITNITGMTNPHTDAETLTSAVMTYDADNRLTTYNGKEIKYDADGNMTYGCLNGRMVYLDYDCRNRLTCVKDQNGITLTRYEYDAENIRTAVIEGNSRTVYVTDREAPYSQILTATAYKEGILATGKQTSQTLYTYGLGLISEQRKTKEAEEETYYYHYNHLGSTTAVTDKQGTITYRFAYDTYGELTDIRDADYHSLKNTAENEGYTKEQLTQAIGITFLYNGQYGVQTDANGLCYMRARYYSQDIKRFINRDVVTGNITNSQSLNRYSYVQGNPVKLTDPFGLCPDSNSAFKNLCKAAYHFDWAGAGHTALDVAGIFWDGADLINAGWYALEGDVKSAAISLTCALPGVGMGAGVKLMKGGKYVEAGKAIYTISRATAGGIGIGAGISIAKTNGTNFFNALSEGRFDTPSFAGMLFGGVLAYASGKTFSTSIKSLSPETAARASKSSITKDSGELSGRPVEEITSFADLMTPQEAKRYNAYWSQGTGSYEVREALEIITTKGGKINTRQRLQVSPGIKSIKDVKYGSRGEVYIRETIFDDYGRKIGVNDYTDHNMPKVPAHTNPHYHPNDALDPGNHGKGIPGLHPDTPK